MSMLWVMRSACSMAVFAVAVTVVAACATTNKPATDIRSPLSATLGPGAATGAPVPLRFDPNAKVIISTAANLPAASYLPSQAQRGEKVYQATCGMCHAGGELVGDRFVATWKDRRVYDLYALVRSTMPLDNPGGLKDGEYLDVIAYLLQANKHVSPGVDSLKADTTALRRTKIDVR
jgi:S-disulfanyl-L-cysteine oxidoreductase SoxD